MDATISVVRIVLEVLGALSLVAGMTIAVLRGPRVKITETVWNADFPVPWTFATVGIRNAPPPRWIPFMTRETAAGSRVRIDFERQSERATPTIDGRWSDRPEPIRTHPQTLGLPAGAPVIVGVFAPELIADSKRLDLPPGGRWEEVAVAVLREGAAYGWGAESYAYPDWNNPEWKLDRGEYVVTVTVESGGKTWSRRFRLPYPSDKMGQFRLTPLDG